MGEKEEARCFLHLYLNSKCWGGRKVLTCRCMTLCTAMAVPATRKVQPLYDVGLSEDGADVPLYDAVYGEAVFEDSVGLRRYNMCSPDDGYHMFISATILYVHQCRVRK